MNKTLHCLWLVAATVFLALSPAMAESSVQRIESRELNRLILREAQQRTVVVNFWATWCAPCRQEIPHLIKADKEYSDDEVLILGVSIDSSSQPVKSFVKRMGVTYPVYIASNDVSRVFRVSAVPRTMVFTKNGLVMDYPGYMSADMLDSVLQRAKTQ